MKEFLTLKHYKEPLKPISAKNGYGYYGALQITLDGDKIQCHQCGLLFQNLSRHILQTHKISSRDFKIKYKLSFTTRLISESERIRMKEKALEYWRSLTDKEKNERKRKAILKYKYWKKDNKNHKIQPKEQLESKNKKGTCPDQLLEKIKEVKNKIGHTPSLMEFMQETGGQRYKHLIFKTFGSWKNALVMGKFQPKEKKSYQKKVYSEEELIEYLKIYYQENNRTPTASDCRLGLIPAYEVYIRHFGSFPKARELAGLSKHAPTKWEQREIISLSK